MGLHIQFNSDAICDSAHLIGRSEEAVLALLQQSEGDPASPSGWQGQSLHQVEVPVAPVPSPLI
jgi:hypothetical protein